MVVMLLRNRSPIEGLCNGTRLLVQRVINGRLLEAKIATGSRTGDIVFIPRIKLSPDEGVFPFEWSRLQFPVRVAFAMTINKSQGQTLTRVGVYLEELCFSHGQLYVAASRVGLPSSIRFAVAPNESGKFWTANIVYTEALTQ
jgi:ATP-dependent DNA helicase PIF1